jgi:hypothetical protein
MRGGRLPTGSALGHAHSLSLSCNCSQRAPRRKVHALASIVTVNVPLVIPFLHFVLIIPLLVHNRTVGRAPQHATGRLGERIVSRQWRCR